MPLLYEINEHKKDGHKFARITGFEGRIADLKVPETIEGYPVEAIGNHAFSGRDDLVTVTLPETVKTLYGFSFHNSSMTEQIFHHYKVGIFINNLARFFRNRNEFSFYLRFALYICPC